MGKTKALTVQIPEEVHIEIKIKSAIKGLKLKEYILELLLKDINSDSDSDSKNKEIN